jgi:peptide chain release factor
MSPHTIPLSERMKQLGLSEDDIEEQFILGSGKGGQKVQKTSSCVLLTHRPSRIQVRSRSSRSQAENRYEARVLLCEQLEEQVATQKEQKSLEKFKNRKRKMIRPPSVKRAIRRSKEHNSSKKTQRRKMWQE